MSSTDVIALLGLCLACFSLGYKIGRDSSNTKSQK